MIVNLEFISQCIDMLAQQGRMAAELHLSAETHKVFVATMLACGAAEVPPTPRLPRKRKDGSRAKPKPHIWKFRGIPLIVNSAIPDGGIITRPLHLLGVENWLEKALEEQRQMAIAHQVATMPMQEPPPQPALPAAEGEEITTNRFLSPTVKTPTDILVEAMTNCDDVQRVIVLTVKADSEIKIVSNASRFEVFGLLQAATSRVAQGE